jgi:hypothetical protein
MSKLKKKIRTKRVELLKYLKKYLNDLEMVNSANIVYLLVFKNMVKKLEKGYYEKRDGEFIKDLQRVGLGNFAKDVRKRERDFNEYS